MPEPVRAYFEHRVFVGGVDQQDLAALAATIELLVREDEAEQLRAAYRLLDLDPEMELPLESAREVMTVFVTCYRHGVNVSLPELTLEWWKAKASVTEDGVAIANKSIDEVIRASPYPLLDSYSFLQVQGVVQAAREAQLQYVHDATDQMKEKLLTFEGSGSGRVSLSAFYRSYVEKGWTMFDERKEFMQQLGALDESDAAQTRVIVPNYLLNPMNCAGPWGYYATCFRSDCEMLMSSLEKSLGTPEAPPGVIAERIAALPSPTVTAPRTLSSALVRKLEEVSQHHRGKVPIHGRLFFQWMHFAYPLECPYPFHSDIVKPMSETQFQEKTGQTAQYTDEEWAQELTPAFSVKPTPSLNCDEDADECLAMWTPVEELVQHREVQRSLAAPVA